MLSLIYFIQDGSSFLQIIKKVLNTATIEKNDIDFYDKSVI